MPNDPAMAKRILCLRIRAPSADAAKLIVSMIKNAVPLYKTFGGTSVRLLRNADDQAQFMQVIEYETDAAIESGRQKLASEPAAQKFVQAWRAMFPGTVDAEIYEDVTSGP